MKSVYRVLAYLVAIEVVIQAAAIAFAMFGLAKMYEGVTTPYRLGGPNTPE
jgi:hypothetical protein